MAYKLKEQAVVVTGSRRAAIYDLAANKIIRIPLEIAQHIDTGALLSGGWFEYLIKLGFLRDMPEAWQAYRNDHAFPLHAPLHTLTLSSKVLSNPLLRRWLAEGAEHLDAAHLAVLASPDAESRSVEFLADIMRDIPAPSCEVLVSLEDGSLRGRIFDRSMQAVFKRSGSATAKHISEFIRADVVTYSTLRAHSELSGVLHVGEEGMLWPHPHERHLSVGSIRVALESVLAGAAYAQVRSNTKDRRDRCRSCEIRYACANPFAYRSSTSITSEPSNCLYRPDAPDPQNHLFAGAAA